MGMFSWDCKRCGHPMLSHIVINKINGWMMDVVVLEEGGSMLRGEYDGYGRVNNREINFRIPVECYHEACWKLSGCPTEFKEASKGSYDQGVFFDDPAHDLVEPKE